jgi:cytochrome c oxidase cbb3-type subunit 1
MFTALWLGGFWQGWQWNNPAIPFIDTVVALKPVWIVRFFSGIMIFTGILLFLFNIFSTALSAGKTPAVSAGKAYTAPVNA